MGQLGEMFPGQKLAKQTPEEAGTGQGFPPGPLDLDGGVVQVRRKAAEPVDADEPAED
jgi:hypothetical protein